MGFGMAARRRHLGDVNGGWPGTAALAGGWHLLQGGEAQAAGNICGRCPPPRAEPTRNPYGDSLHAPDRGGLQTCSARVRLMAET